MSLLKLIYFFWLFNAFPLITALFCLRIFTLNLSKSVKFSLVILFSCFFPHDDALILSSSLNAVISFFNWSLCTALVILSLNSVKVILLIDISCLLMPLLGPSINTFVVLIKSTTTATFPICFP